MAAARTAITCFGEALIDFLARPPATPDAPRQFVEYAGGAPANVAVGVARLGGDARFVGMLSTDMFGDALLAEFTRYGVGVAQVRRTDAARTALAFVSLDAQGERSFSFYRPPAADLLFGVEDFDRGALATTAVFHACSNSLTEDGIAAATLHGMQLATEGGALVSMDVNLRPALWPRGVDPAPAIWQALAKAHLVKLSREELAFLAENNGVESALSRLFSGATQVVVATDSAASIRWWARDGSGDAPTCRVQVVDTTAAGDAFVAGLLHRLVARSVGRADLADAFADDALRDDLLRHAAATGALATTRHGAFAAMPSAIDVQTLLAIHA